MVMHHNFKELFTEFLLKADLYCFVFALSGKLLSLLLWVSITITLIEYSLNLVRKASLF